MERQKESYQKLMESENYKREEHETQDKKIRDTLDKNNSKQIRTKQVKILSGFFPVFLYFSVEINLETKQVQQQIVTKLKNEQVLFQTLKDKHITLTKTINILQSEVKQLHKKIEKSFKGRANLPIILLFKKVTVLQNFVCLQVQKITEIRLKRITEFIGETIKDPYFENPIYHISLLKLLQKPTEQLKKELQDIRLKTKIAMLLSDIFMNAGIKKFKLSVK